MTILIRTMNGNMNVFCQFLRLEITLLLMLCSLHVFGSTLKPKTGFKPVTDPNDMHGGVPMGVPSDFCDNAKVSICNVLSNIYKI